MVDSRQFMTTTSTPKAKINTVRLFTIKGRLTDEVNLEDTLATRNIGLFKCKSGLQLAIVVGSSDSVWIMAVHRATVVKFNNGHAAVRTGDYVFGSMADSDKGKPGCVTVYGQTIVCDLCLDV